MEVTLFIRSGLGKRQFIPGTHPKLLLFSHASHIRRVCGWYLAIPSIGRFVAMSAWAARLPALAS